MASFNQQALDEFKTLYKASTADDLDAGRASVDRLKGLGFNDDQIDEGLNSIAAQPDYELPPPTMMERAGTFMSEDLPGYAEDLRGRAVEGVKSLANAIYGANVPTKIEAAKSLADTPIDTAWRPFEQLGYGAKEGAMEELPSFVAGVGEQISGPNADEQGRVGALRDYLAPPYSAKAAADPHTLYPPKYKQAEIGMVEPGNLDLTARPLVKHQDVEGSLKDDPGNFYYDYNTPLSPDEEDEFQGWIKAIGRQKDLYDYDMRGWWKANGGRTPALNTDHLTDQFKKPNHPTFSDESEYSGVDGNFGGQWSGNDKVGWTFTPSPTNLKMHTPEELSVYFHHVEPNSVLNLDPSAAQNVIPEFGSVSTTRPMAIIDQDGKTVLIPTVVAEPQPHILTDSQAVEHYQKTGEHLGRFDSMKAASAFAKRLYQQQAATVDQGELTAGPRGRAMINPPTNMAERIARSTGQFVTGQLPVLEALGPLGPGGSFAAYESLKAGNEGATRGEKFESGVKGGALGTAIGAAHVLKRVPRIAAVGGGTMLQALAQGASPEQALESGIQMGIFTGLGGPGEKTVREAGRDVFNEGRRIYLNATGKVPGQDAGGSGGGGSGPSVVHEGEAAGPEDFGPVPEEGAVPWRVGPEGTVYPEGAQEAGAAQEAQGGPAGPTELGPTAGEPPGGRRGPTEIGTAAVPPAEAGPTTGIERPGGAGRPAAGPAAGAPGAEDVLGGENPPLPSPELTRISELAKDMSWAELNDAIDLTQIHYDHVKTRAASDRLEIYEQEKFDRENGKAPREGRRAADREAKGQAPGLREQAKVPEVQPTTPALDYHQQKYIEQHKKFAPTATNAWLEDSIREFRAKAENRPGEAHYYNTLVDISESVLRGRGVKVPEVEPTRPGHTYESVLGMSPDELERAVEIEKKHERDALIEVFGEKGAKRYEQLERTANSPYDIARADAAAAEMAKMEANLTPAQEKRLYGIGEGGYNAEELRDIARAARDYAPDNVSDSPIPDLLNTVGRELLTGHPWERAASAVRLRGALVELARRGKGRDIILKAIEQRARQQGTSPGDAIELFNNTIEKLKNVDAFRGTPSEAPPQQQLPGPEKKGRPDANTPYVTTPADVAKKTWYHGSGTSDMTGDRLDPLMTKVDNLFSHGVYMTDDIQVGRGYATSRGRQKNPNLYEVKLPQGARLLDLEATAPQFLLEAIKKHVDEWSGMVGENYAEELAALRQKSPHPTGREVWRALSEAISVDSHQEQIPSYEYSELIQGITEDLHKLGYDGFTHRGGKKSQNPYHQVAILWDPNAMSGLPDARKIPVEMKQIPLPPKEGPPVKGVPPATEPAPAPELPPEAPMPESDPGAPRLTYEDMRAHAERAAGMTNEELQRAIDAFRRGAENGSENDAHALKVYEAQLADNLRPKNDPARPGELGALDPENEPPGPNAFVRRDGIADQPDPEEPVHSAPGFSPEVEHPTGYPEGMEKPTDAELIEGEPLARTGIFSLFGIRKATSRAQLKELVRRSNINRELARRLGATIRKNRVGMKGALGVFSIPDEMIRTNLEKDFPTRAHEIGHLIDYRVFSNVPGKGEDPMTRPIEKSGIRINLFAPFMHELKPLATPGYPGPEGFAEFVSLYVNFPSLAQQAAPTFYPFFEKTVGERAPEVLDTLKWARGELERFNLMSATDKTASDIDRYKQPRLFERIKAGLKENDLYHDWVNRQAAVVRLRKQFGKEDNRNWYGKRIHFSGMDALEDPETMFSLLGGWVARGNSFIDRSAPGWLGRKFGAVGGGALDFKTQNVIGPAMGDIMMAVDSAKDMDSYMVARAVLDHMNSPKGPLMEFVMPKQQAIDTIKEIEAKYPHYPRVFDALTNLEDQSVRYLVDSGRLGEDNYAAMRAAIAQHVPLYRIMDDDMEGFFKTKGKGGAGKSVADLHNPIYRLKGGSDRDIVSPLESMINNIYTNVNLAERNLVGQVLLNFAKGKSRIGSQIEIIKPEMVPQYRLTEEDIDGILRKYSRKDISQRAQTVFDTVRLVGGQSHPVWKELVNLLVDRGYTAAQAKKIADRIRAAGAANPGGTDKMIDSLQNKIRAKEIKAELDLTIPRSGVPIFRPAIVKRGEPIISVYYNGKPVYARVSPALWEVVKGLDREEAGVLMRAVSPTANMMREMRTRSPDFFLWNLAKDEMTATVQSRYGFTPIITPLVGLVNLGFRTDLARRYQLSGAAHANLMSFDRKFMGQTLERLVAEAKPFGRSIFLLRHPVEAFRVFSDIFENMSRVGEYAQGQWIENRRAAAEGRVLPEREMMARLGIAAKRVSTDFERGGSYAKAINRSSMFWNSTIQGPYGAYEAVKNDPIGAPLRAFMMATVPAVLLWYYNKDNPRIQEVNQYAKDNLFLIPSGTITADEWNALSKKQKAEYNLQHPIYGWPKGFEIGLLFATGAEHFLDWAYKRDPDAINKFFPMFLNALLPSNPFISSAAGPIFENITNHIPWNGNEVVPRDMTQLEPIAQHTHYTSALATKIAGLMNAILPRGRDSWAKYLTYDVGLQSPMKVENLIRGYTGGIGQLGSDLVDQVVQWQQGPDDPVAPEKTLADRPIIRRFVRRFPMTTAASLQKFWDQYDASLEAHSTWANYGKTEEREKQKEIEKRRSFDLEMWPIAESAASTLSMLRATADGFRRNKHMTPHEKTVAIDATTFEMIKTAQQFDRAADHTRERYARKEAEAKAAAAEQNQGQPSTYSIKSLEELMSNIIPRARPQPTPAPPTPPARVAPMPPAQLAPPPAPSQRPTPTPMMMAPPPRRKPPALPDTMSSLSRGEVTPGDFPAIARANQQMLLDRRRRATS